MRLLIQNGTIVSDGASYQANLLAENGVIRAIAPGWTPRANGGSTRPGALCCPGLSTRTRTSTCRSATS